MSNLSCLIQAGDKNKWIWHPFKIYWDAYKDERLKSYFVTEEAIVNWHDIQNISTGKMPFADQMLSALEEIDEKYILFTIDDFFPIKKIDCGKLNNIVYQMKSLKMPLVKLFKNPHTMAVITQCETIPTDKLIEYPFDSPYMTSLQVSIWEKEYLKQLLIPGESGWDFEMRGNPRVKQLNRMTYQYCGDGVFDYIEILRHGRVRKGSEKYIERETLKCLGIKNQKS